MRRTILSNADFAALAVRGRQPIVWSQQPLQQQMDGPDDDKDDTDVDDKGGDDNDDVDDNGDDDGKDDADTDDRGDDDEPLGPKGTKALAAIKAKLKAERARRIAAEKKNGAADKDDDDKVEAARQEILSKANNRILRSEVRAAAAGKLADPADAIKFLDLDQFEVGEDGDVDQDEIADAIKDLVAEKPYLAAQGGEPKKRTPKGDRRQGGGSREATGTVSAGRSLYASRKK